MPFINFLNKPKFRKKVQSSNYVVCDPVHRRMLLLTFLYQIPFLFSALFQGISILLSITSLSLSIVSYVQASRWANPEKPQMTPMGYTFNFLWRFFIVFSRVFMLSIFATEFQKELFVFLGLHWLLMSLWIFMMVSQS